MSGSPRSIRWSWSVAIGRQRLSTISAVGPEMSASSRSRCSPQSRRRVSRAIVLVVGDDVHLGVVQEGVGVQVGGADGEPAVVDDPDLGVDVDDVAQLCFAGVDGAGEEALVVAVGCDQGCDLAA